MNEIGILIFVLGLAAYLMKCVSSLFIASEQFL
jgi:hypothetical protein